MTRASFATPNSSRMSAAFFMTGQSDWLPIKMLTSGFFSLMFFNPEIKKPALISPAGESQL